MEVICFLIKEGTQFKKKKCGGGGFSADSGGKEFACSAGDLSLNSGSGRSPGERNGNPLQYSCLENFMDRAAWQVTVHAVSKSPTQLSDLSLLHSKKANKINRYIFMPRIYPGMDTRVKANYSQFSLVQSLSCVWLL